jgi:hypothetical protein
MKVARLREIMLQPRPQSSLTHRKPFDIASWSGRPSTSAEPTERLRSPACLGSEKSATCSRWWPTCRRNWLRSTTRTSSLSIELGSASAHEPSQKGHSLGCMESIGRLDWPMRIESCRSEIAFRWYRPICSFNSSGDPKEEEHSEQTH